MARFVEVKAPSSSLTLSSKRCFLVNGQITFEDVNQLNSLNQPILLLLNNTKGQNSEIISLIDGRNIKFSVLGGLDYINKRKYLDDKYINRTILYPKNLSNIIKIFESIERKIDYSWTESQKCMYVYRSLCESMFYNNGSDFINGLDVSRSLNGLLYNRAVCAGFALIFKEMMDRLGIYCLYQNVPSNHSWNAVRLDGDYYLLDLTWDVCNKSRDGKCTFEYFGTQDSKDFYSHWAHDIRSQSEEIVIPSKVKTKNQIQNDLEIISRPKTLYTHEMKHYSNPNGDSYNYIYLGESAGLDIYVAERNNAINYFYTDKNDDFRKYLSDKALSTACSYNDHNLSKNELPANIKRLSRYSRDDGSNFLLCQTNKKFNSNVKEYLMIEPTLIGGKKVLKRTSIISENDLVNNKNADFKHIVANRLLSPERVSRKIQYFNGYVGFVSGNMICYDRTFETEELGIQNRH